MTDTEAGIVAIVFAAALIVAVAGLILLDEHLTKARKAREAEEDRHHADVLRWKQEAVVVARSPLLEDTWRDAVPGETPGTVVPDDAPAPVYIARTPRRIALARAEDAGRAAERRVSQQQKRRQGVGRHRAELRDDTAVLETVHGLATATQVDFVNALKVAGEEPPKSFGPPELMHRRVVWQDEPPTWEQTALDVGVSR